MDAKDRFMIAIPDGLVFHLRLNQVSTSLVDQSWYLRRQRGPDTTGERRAVVTIYYIALTANGKTTYFTLVGFFRATAWRKGGFAQLKFS